MLPDLRRGGAVYEEVFKVFRCVAGCAKFVNCGHVPSVFEVQPRPDHTICILLSVLP